MKKMFSCCMCNKDTKKGKVKKNNIDEMGSENFKKKNSMKKSKESLMNSDEIAINWKYIGAPSKMFGESVDECVQTIHENKSTKDGDVEPIPSLECIRTMHEEELHRNFAANGMTGPLFIYEDKKKERHFLNSLLEIDRTDRSHENGDNLLLKSLMHEDPPLRVHDFINTNGKKRPKRSINCLLFIESDEKNVVDGPIGKNELALRRYQFFSNFISELQEFAVHRIRFNPLAPIYSESKDDLRKHLEPLVTRLENVTRHLESIQTKFFADTQEIAVQTQNSSLKQTDSISENNSIINQVKEPDPTVTTMSVAGYDDLVGGAVKDFLMLSQKIGGDVATHSKLVEKAFEIQRDFIRTVATRPAPANASEQLSLLGPTSSQIQLIQEYRENNRDSVFFNHLSAISESIPALGWVAVSPTPAPYVKEMNDAGQFYTNRVLKEWKVKDRTHVEWCNAWVRILLELQQYVRQHHTTGLVWAKTGSGAVPPPPPPNTMPPPPCMPTGDISSVSVNDDRSALFAQINRGEDITKSLKKVTADMQTHKNTSLRTGPAPFKAPVVSNSGGSPMKSVPPANAPIDKPPIFKRDGKKWLVEYQKGNKNLLIENAEMNNVVYMYRCQDSQLVVKGKINSVVIDSCRKSSIVFDSLVSSIEFVNCQSVQMQVLGKVPTISIDKTDGCQMYLSSDSLEVELISSKSSEMNIMVPKGNGDYTEYPVPEQFKTTISPKGLNTCAIDSLG